MYERLSLSASTFDTDIHVAVDKILNGYFTCSMLTNACSLTECEVIAAVH